MRVEKKQALWKGSEWAEEVSQSVSQSVS